MIGSFLIDVLMLRNKLYGDAITVYALGTNEKPKLDFGDIKGWTSSIY